MVATHKVQATHMLLQILVIAETLNQTSLGFCYPPPMEFTKIDGDVTEEQRLRQPIPSLADMRQRQLRITLRLRECRDSLYPQLRSYSQHTTAPASFARRACSSSRMRPDASPNDSCLHASARIDKSRRGSKIYSRAAHRSATRCQLLATLDAFPCSACEQTARRLQCADSEAWLEIVVEVHILHLSKNQMS